MCALPEPSVEVRPDPVSQASAAGVTWVLGGACPWTHCAVNVGEDVYERLLLKHLDWYLAELEGIRLPAAFTSAAWLTWAVKIWQH